MYYLCHTIFCDESSDISLIYDPPLQSRIMSELFLEKFKQSLPDVPFEISEVDGGYMIAVPDECAGKPFGKNAITGERVTIKVV